MTPEPRPLKIVCNPEIRAQYEATLDLWRKELTAGKVSIRWIQSVAGYKLYARGKVVLGTECFINPDEAIAWAKETLGLDLSKARVIE